MKTATDARLVYAPERIWEARHAYFESGQPPHDGWVDHALLRSWQRCRAQGRSVSESVVFDSVERPHLARLRDQHHPLLEAAGPELDSLGATLAEAGYAVLLTDAHGRTLAVGGRTDGRSQALRQAFRPGVDLSESAIGTSAMSLALAEREAVRVLGPEHFFVGNQIFHCCAAPVFDPLGRLVGALDATRDMPGLAAGAMALTQRCAKRIERRLFERQPAFVRVRLEPQDALEEACLAFDRDGRLVAANLAACRLIDVPCVGDGLGFDDLFEERFEPFVSALRRDDDVRVRLQGGVRLRAQPYAPVNAAVSPPASGRPVALGRATAARPASAAAPADPAFAVAFGHALRAFEAALPVLVIGETGTGKEVAARALHAASRRRDGPLLAINCGAIAPELIAAELFGHAEGAYTGARRGGSIGKIAAAQGGTVLLDEIGEMPLDLQVALLRVLDERELTPVGAVRPVPVDVRFVCATHRDLPALVAAGRFREDLFYRLGAFILAVPPLRARQDFDAVVDAVCAQIGCDPGCVTSELRHALQAMPWPGNVRQLKHALTLAAAMARPGEPLRLADMQTSTSLSPKSAVARGDGRAASLKELQQWAIDDALRRTNGNVAAAAKVLGVGRATLYRKLTR
jgi:transcriptional regulator of acetoin/glycerol metabolism